MNNIEIFLDRIIEGDCLTVMESLPSGSIDMVLCDLPYGITHNSWDSVIDISSLWQHYKRIIKPGGVIVLTGQGAFTAQLIISNREWFRYKVIWIKSKATNFLNVKKQPLRKHEDICVFYPGKAVYHPRMTDGKPYDRGIRHAPSENYNKFRPARIQNVSGQRYPNDVVFFEEEAAADFVYFKTAETEGDVFHPTQKPVSLGRYLISTYSNPGAIVLDNACGSGSFLVAAILEGRRFIGIEKNELRPKIKSTPVNLIQVCEKRVADAIQQKNNN